ncbi:MAG: hypothetical protein GY857_14040 [Desulfobacula sp.]|nr:hypothetical protein [Desulfobacula sp.]
MDYQHILKKIHTKIKPVITRGKVADYIPKLAAVHLNKFGMAVQTLNGKLFSMAGTQALESFTSKTGKSVF